MTRFCARRTIAARLSFLAKETIMSGADAVVLVHGGFEVAGSHSIFLSQPAAMAGLIEQAASGVKAES